MYGAYAFSEVAYSELLAADEDATNAPVDPDVEQIYLVEIIAWKPEE